MSGKSEVEAMTLLFGHLIQSKTSFTFIARPDGDPAYDVNIDFLIQIGSEKWAIEIMRLTLDSQWVAAKKRMLSQLSERLDALTKAEKAEITLMIAPPLGLKDKVQQEAWLDQVCSEVDSAIKRRRSDCSPPGGTVLLKYDHGTPGVQLFTALNNTAELLKELLSSCSETLTYKLKDQLPASSSHYSKRGIILDSRQDDSEMPSFAPITEHTVRGLLDQVQNSPDITSVDGAWWISGEAIIKGL